MSSVKKVKCLGVSTSEMRDASRRKIHAVVVIAIVLASLVAGGLFGYLS